MFKKVLKFILILAPWFLSSLIVKDFSYFKEINTPSFSLPSNLFGIFWTALYILIAISVYKVSEIGFNKSYLKNLLYNYIFNQLYVITFFLLKNPFLAFIDTLLTLITSLFLYYETKEISKNASKYLIPYPLFLVYATILSLSVYFINL